MSTTLNPPSTKRRSRTAVKPSIAKKSPSAKQQEIQAIYDTYSPKNLRRDNIDWVNSIFLVAVHVGALAAPFFFSWYGLVAFCVLHWLTGSIGICLGYHRYLSHRSMKLRKPAEFLALAAGTISGEGTPLMWSATHRLHHNRADLPGDPHSPLDGSFWSHMLWLFVRHGKSHKQSLYNRYVPELLNRPMMQFFEKTQGLWLLGTGATLIGIGYALADRVRQ